MRTGFAAVLVAVSLAFMPAATAQSAGQGNPGLVSPSSPLYGLEVAMDNAAVSVGLKRASGVARERVAEAERMAERNNSRGMQKPARNLGSLSDRMQEDEQEEMSQAITGMESLVEDAPNEQARQGMQTALQNMREARERARQAGNGSAPERPETPGEQPGQQLPAPGPAPGTGQEPQQDTGGKEETGTSPTGSFTLMVSDQPADISSFDYVRVSFDSARIFPAGRDENETEEMEENDTEESMNDTEEGNSSSNTTETAMETAEKNTVERFAAHRGELQVQAGSPQDRGSGESQGFTTLQLQNATVDLKEVQGERAAPLVETELEAGSYSRVELYVSQVNASVDGSSVDVKVPPGRLMINRPFEISEQEETEFVFDIHIVQRGGGPNSQGYILRPTISESGVAGQDVEVEEVNATELPEQARR